ncbi:MAG: 2Fe-2S iron-sulfur cluster-binding protein [Haloarculaceae archaeon]
MPTVEFRGETIECDSGEVLRDVLLDAGLDVHNGPRLTSCHGHGTCGTCAVEITDGDAEEPDARERARLRVPPHSPDAGLRLSCQVRVTDDLVVEKHGGFWGTKRKDGA